MQLKSGDFCPLIGSECINLKCKWFTQIRGTNPNTGEPVDEWDCAVKWVPFLVIESSQQSRQTGAAVESLRNEIVKGNKETQDLYRHSLNQIMPTSINILEGHGE
jgi:hypothetical protein